MKASTCVEKAKDLVIGFAVMMTFAAIQATPVQAQKSVTGHGEIAFAGIDEKFSFSSVRHKDGSVTGQFEIRDRFDDNSPDQVLHGVVTCMRTQMDGSVRLGGLVTHTNAAAAPYVGTFVLWQVVDGGQGGKNDTASGLWFGFTNPAYVPLWCDGMINFSFIVQRPIERGNLTVKP